MTLTVPTMTGDNKAYAIVASLPSNCGQSLTTTFRGNREYKEDKEDGWLKQNDEKKISSSTDSDNKNNSKEDIPTLNQKCNYLLDYTNKNTTSTTIHCSSFSLYTLLAFSVHGVHVPDTNNATRPYHLTTPSHYNHITISLNFYQFHLTYLSI